MLAIVIPYYKLSFFEDTLQSLSQQCDQRFAVYIGDDNSPESPNSLLAKYKGKFNFNYYKFDQNRGSTSLVSHWQRCINLTQDEDWIMILGDDDTLEANFVAEFYTNLQDSTEYNVIRFAVQKINEKNSKISDLYRNSRIESVKNIIFEQKRSSLSEYVFRRSKLLSVGFKNFPLAWWSDLLLVLECSDFGNIYSVNHTFVNVRISDKSISGNTAYYKQKQMATFEFYEYLLSYKRENFTESELFFLEYKWQKVYLNDKKNIQFFMKICQLYLYTKSFTALRVFLKAVISNVMKKYSRESEF